MMKWLFVIALFFCTSAQAMDYKEFETLPVLHEGRIKPMSSLALYTYKTLQNAPYAGEDKAVDFFARALFDPAQSAEEKLVVIRDVNLLRLLGLDEARHEYALSELTGPLSAHDKDVAMWLTQDEKSLSQEQKALIALYDRMVLYTQVLRSFTLLLPLDIALEEKDRQRYTPDGNVTFYALQNRGELLRGDINALVKRKGRDLEKYSKREQSLVELSYQIDQIRNSGAGNTMFRILPSDWNRDWLSPWDMTLNGQGSPASQKILNLWQAMAKSWRAGDEVTFAAKAHELNIIMKGQKSVSPWRLQLERIYYLLPLLPLSLILYIGSLIAFGLRRNKAAYTIGAGALSVHAIDVIMRILILMRPPVGTLFESILFVGFVGALLLFISRPVLKNDLGAQTGMALGALLQFTALGFTQNGDTLQNLQAVLNTPFWLAIHVLVITAGYAACLCTSALAQVSFIWKDKIKDGVLWFMSSLSLLLTATGTLLGGLWADQSWGRFWGWDPKENGALLIVLWISWALHARLSGHLSALYFKTSLAMLSVVVALAWFGVNLLATGLHSYGFIGGIASGLFAFIIAQTGVVAWLMWKARSHEHKA